MFEATLLFVVIVGVAIGLMLLGAYIVEQGDHERCFFCKEPIAPDDLVLPTEDIGLHRTCLQRNIDGRQGGKCPFCNNRIDTLDKTSLLTCAFNEGDVWYHAYCYNQKNRPVINFPGPVTTKEITKEVVVKMKCRYCNNVYNETLDKCPHCGGKR